MAFGKKTKKDPPPPKVVQPGEKLISLRLSVRMVQHHQLISRVAGTIPCEMAAANEVISALPPEVGKLIWSHGSHLLSVTKKGPDTWTIEQAASFVDSLFPAPIAA
jgi:hypothetical protein